MLRVACCVLRVACCVLRLRAVGCMLCVVCCVLRVVYNLSYVNSVYCCCMIPDILSELHET